MSTTPEQFATLLDNQRRTHRKPVALDHVPGPQEVLSILLREAGISHLYDTFHFHPRRDWRVDIAIPAENPWLLIEVDGNGVGGHPGAHRSLKGYEDDRERDAEALMLGFIVLRLTPRQITNGLAMKWIRTLLEKKDAHEY